MKYITLFLVVSLAAMVPEPGDAFLHKLIPWAIKGKNAIDVTARKHERLLL
uniref:Uncharacterized protein n=1 Tax=Neogobius melanostomus TaxID=47308 RepID=A0A8C6URW4_9GOBI